MRFPPRHDLLFRGPVIAALLIGFGLPPSGWAAEKSSSHRAAIESIRADELAEYVGRLADPAMEGREAGARGGKTAGDFLVEQYHHIQLRGAGDNGGYFQHFAPNFRNVLAMLPGGDPALRDQFVLICAHYDHIGYGGRGYSVGPYGYVYPGADDNASGTAAVLELAQAFTILAVPPKRSILFAHWDAEEKGLLGSKHFTAHPTVPLDRIAAVVNLDMIGRLRDGNVWVFGSRSGAGWRRLLSLQNDSDGLTLLFPWTLRANADHWPFFERGIPVVMFHTGIHADYHRTSDVADRINAPGMMELARLIFGVAHALADGLNVPAYRAAARHETPETEKAILDQAAAPPDRLGVSWIEDAASTGGVVVSKVKAGSAAERAGLRRGDRIVRFAGRDIRDDDDFYAAVSSAENPAALTVQRPGEEKPLEITASLDGRALRWGIVWRVDEAEPGAVILTHVVRGSPAARAGLAPRDRLYQVGGRDFVDDAEFARLVNARSDALHLTVERDGRVRAVRVHREHKEPLQRAA